MKHAFKGIGALATALAMTTLSACSNNSATPAESTSSGTTSAAATTSPASTGAAASTTAGSSAASTPSGAAAPSAGGTSAAPSTAARTYPPMTGSLTASIWGVKEDLDSIKAAAAGFLKDNPGVKITWRTSGCGADYSACKTLIAGHNMSDVVVTGTWNFNQMVNDGVLLDLNDRLAKDGISDTDFTPIAIGSDKAAKDGHYHGLPMGFNIQSLFYNKTMFAKAGLAAPAADGSYTYDDLREWAKKLTLDSNGNNAESPKFDAKHIVQWGYDNRIAQASPSDAGYNPVLWSYGGGLLTGPGRATCSIDSTQSTQALQLLEDMMWTDHTAVTPQMDTATPGYLRWIQGHVAMQQGSHEQVGIAKAQNPGLQYDMAALPKGPAGNATLAQVHSWAVYSGTKSPDLATRFVEYMATTGSGKQMGLIPAYKNNAAGPDFAQAAGEPAHLVDAQLTPAGWPLTRTNIDPQGVLSEVEGQDGIGPAMAEISTGKKPAAEALKGACAKVNSILASAKH